MPYVPVSVDVYVSAFAGMMGAIANVRQSTDNVAIDYDHDTKVAGAFAQAFDALYNKAAPNELQLAEIQSITNELFSNMFPTGVGSELATGLSYSALAGAVIARLTQADAFFLAAGIVPPSGGTVASELPVYNTIAVGAVNSGRLIDATIPSTAGVSFVFVKSVKDWFRWDPLSVLTADGNAVVALLANGVAAGRYLRCMIPAPEWIQQRQWVIRPTTGNDENNGADDVTPLATAAEWHRRWGIVLGVKPELGPGDYHIFFPEGTTAVAGNNSRAYVSARRSETSVGSAFIINTIIFVHGNTPATLGAGVAFAGPFTISAVTAVNHATNQALQIASAGIAVSWTAAALFSTTGSNVAKRCRMTTGANIGGTFWAQEDLGNLLGGNPTAMCDEPAAPNVYTAAFAASTATFTPAVGEQFVVETLNLLGGVLDTDPSVSLIFDSVSAAITEAHGSRAFFDKCQIQSISSTTQAQVGFLARATVNGCRFSAETSARDTWLQCENVDIVNGCVAGALLIECSQQGNITRGFIHGLSGSLRLASATHAAASSNTARNSGWNIVSLGIFSVSNTQAFQIADTIAFSATTEIWGSGNTFPPMGFLANAKLFWPAVTIAGGAIPASYFYINVAASNGLWANNDTATNTLATLGATAPAYDTATNLFTANRNLTSVNLQATVPAGGFDGRFFDPLTGAQMMATQQG